MLINFIGSPHSGKTTTAARLFDHFKTSDIPSEFITERARQYIVEKRFKEKLIPGQKLYLTDDDQLAIMKQQLLLEGAYVYTLPRQTIVLSDSSPLNTLLYLSPEGRKRSEVVGYIRASLSVKPLVFWARVTPGNHSQDTNRIHGEIVSRKIDEEIPNIIQEFVPDLKFVELFGSPTQRYTQVLNQILNAFA